MIPSEIVAALVAGCSVALKDTASQAVKDAYSGLRSLVVGRFNVASVDLLERDPTKEAFRGATEAEISELPDLLSDPELAEKIVTLYDAIEKNSSEEDLRSVGIDVNEVISKRDTIVRNVSGFDVGFQGERVESGQDTLFESISGKKVT